MDWCTCKWDGCDNQGEGIEVVDACYQLVGIVSVGLYNLMADVQEMVRLNCGSFLTIH